MPRVDWHVTAPHSRVRRHVGYRWTSYGFERTARAAGRDVSTEVRLPLRQAGVLLGTEKHTALIKKT